MAAAEVVDAVEHPAQVGLASGRPRGRSRRRGTSPSARRPGRGEVVGAHGDDDHVRVGDVGLQRAGRRRRCPSSSSARPSLVDPLSPSSVTWTRVPVSLREQVPEAGDVVVAVAVLAGGHRVAEPDDPHRAAGGVIAGVRRGRRSAGPWRRPGPTRGPAASRSRASSHGQRRGHRSEQHRDAARSGGRTAHGPATVTGDRAWLTRRWRRSARAGCGA